MATTRGKIMNERINEIKGRIEKLPPTPWHYSDGDDFDHWQVWGDDCVHLVQDDSGVLPDQDFIDFILHAKDDINYLLSLIDQPERLNPEASQEDAIV
ncbi:hypothetical protein HC928_02760 [bacterium]|nr:hypothetical protein [bacterium]